MKGTIDPLYSGALVKSWIGVDLWTRLVQQTRVSVYPAGSVWDSDWWRSSLKCNVSKKKTKSKLAFRMAYSMSICITLLNYSTALDRHIEPTVVCFCLPLSGNHKNHLGHPNPVLFFSPFHFIYNGGHWENSRRRVYIYSVYRAIGIWIDID